KRDSNSRFNFSVRLTGHRALRSCTIGFIDLLNFWIIEAFVRNPLFVQSVQPFDTTDDSGPLFPAANVDHKRLQIAVKMPSRRLANFVTESPQIQIFLRF